MNEEKAENKTGAFYGNAVESLGCTPTRTNVMKRNGLRRKWRKRGRGCAGEDSEQASESLVRPVGCMGR